jgi:hypothetical protein
MSARTAAGKVLAQSCLMAAGDPTLALGQAPQPPKAPAPGPKLDDESPARTASPPSPRQSAKDVKARQEPRPVIPFRKISRKWSGLRHQLRLTGAAE